MFRFVERGRFSPLMETRPALERYRSATSAASDVHLGRVGARANPKPIPSERVTFACSSEASRHTCADGGAHARGGRGARSEDRAAVERETGARCAHAGEATRVRVGGLRPARACAWLGAVYGGVAVASALGDGAREPPRLQQRLERMETGIEVLAVHVEGGAAVHAVLPPQLPERGHR